MGKLIAWEKRVLKKRPWINASQKDRSILARINPRLKQKALDKLSIIRGWHSRLLKLSRPKTKTQLIEEFLGDFNSGMLHPDETIRSITHISRSGLYNWLRLYQKEKLAGLIPKYSDKAKLSGKEKASFRPLKYPIELKFSGPPRRSGKFKFQERLKRRWKNLPLECPINLGIFYSMPIPPGTTMSRRMRMLNHRISHIGRPNLNSLDAFIIKCFTGIIFKDHSQIFKFHSEKFYSWWPQTRVLIRTFKG